MRSVSPCCWFFLRWSLLYNPGVTNMAINSSGVFVPGGEFGGGYGYGAGSSVARARSLSFGQRTSTNQTTSQTRSQQPPLLKSPGLGIRNTLVVFPANNNGFAQVAPPSPAISAQLSSVFTPYGTTS